MAKVVKMRPRNGSHLISMERRILGRADAGQADSRGKRQTWR